MGHREIIAECRLQVAESRITNNSSFAPQYSMYMYERIISSPFMGEDGGEGEK